MKRRYALYSRVSTLSQVELGYSLEVMDAKCRAYVQAQGDAEIVKTYEDRGVSGTLSPEKRPALSQFLNDMRSGAIEFDTLMVFRWDRLGRNLRDVINLEFELRKAGKSLESLSEKIETASPTGKLVFGFLAGVAEMESSNISMRTKVVMAAKVGEIPLGGQPPFGYSRLADGKFKINEEKAEIIRMIFKKYRHSKSYLGVARYLNSKGIPSPRGKTWNHKQISRCLANQFYSGRIVWNKRSGRMGTINKKCDWIIKVGNHVPIISEKEFNRVQNILELDT